MMLLGCFSVQRTYGKEPDSLGAITKIFQRVLAKYPGDEVLKAFEMWLTRSPDFPTPADIVNIIDPPPTKEEIEKAEIAAQMARVQARLDEKKRLKEQHHA